MARIRTIKPEFWSDEKMAPLSPLTRLTFLGLISMADDEGRLLDSEKQLDGLLFPSTEDSCRKALGELSAIGRIQRGETASGQRVIQIANWKAHQKIDKPNRKAAHPKITTFADVSPTPPRQVADSSDDASALHTSDLRPTTNDPSGRSRKKRAKPDGLGRDWMLSFAAVWDCYMTPGRFPYSRAAKPLSELLKLNLKSDYIATCIADYLKRKGVPFPRVSTDPDTWRPAKFRPDFSDFADNIRGYDRTVRFEDLAEKPAAA